MFRPTQRPSSGLEFFRDCVVSAWRMLRSHHRA